MHLSRDIPRLGRRAALAGAAGLLAAAGPAPVGKPPAPLPPG